MKKNNSQIDIQYILTTKKFFSEGACGRVSHAYGFIKGCIENNASVELISEKNAKIFFNNFDSNLTISSPNKISHLNFLIYSFKTAKKRTAIVIRWRPIIPYFYIFLLFRNRNCWLEINSITGLDSKSKLIFYFTKYSIKLAARFFNIITVSENSLNKIKEITSIKNENIVMPNGFITESFEKTNPYFSQSHFCSLIYFGKKQDYYDWKMLFSSIPYLIQKKIIYGLDIFGFKENLNTNGINYHGTFTQNNIASKINKIPNPILILHASDSEIAKSGSPMKLFEYAALGLPVIISSSLQQQAIKFKNFHFYEAGNQSNFIEMISKVCTNYDLEKEKAIASRDIAYKNYSWKAVVTPWLKKNHIISNE